MAYTCDIIPGAVLAPDCVGEGAVRAGAGLTDLEKPTQHTALSNTPRPSTCKVERETESQMRTWGGSGCRKETGLLPGGAQLPAPPRPTPVSWPCPLHSVTFPSLVVPATCPVAMVTISGWTARLQRERTDGQVSVGARGTQDPSYSMPVTMLAYSSTSWLTEFLSQ